jgi:hypothetical protein
VIIKRTLTALCAFAFLSTPIAHAQVYSLSENIEQLSDVYANLRVGDEQVAYTQGELVAVEAKLDGLLQTRLLNIQEAIRLSDAIQVGIDEIIIEYSYFPTPDEPVYDPLPPEEPAIVEPVTPEEPTFDPIVPTPEVTTPEEEIIQPVDPEVTEPEIFELLPEIVEPVTEPEAVIDPIIEPSPEVTISEEVVEPVVEPAPVEEFIPEVSPEESVEPVSEEIVPASLESRPSNDCWVLAPVRWTKSGAGWVWSRLT